jgi:hypothetical protein
MPVYDERLNNQRRTSPTETAHESSRLEVQVKEEEIQEELLSSTIHFDNSGTDESDQHLLHALETTTSLRPSTSIAPSSPLDKDIIKEVQRLLQINENLESCLKVERVSREKLEAENDKLHKTQIQLQEQNSNLQQDCQLWNDRAVKVRHFYRTLQAEFHSLQERYEEKCRQLREYERQHPQQERMKQEHDDELQQPPPLQSGRGDDDFEAEAAPVVAAYSEMVPREHGRAEEVEESSDGEDVDGRDSEEEDSDERPSKRQVMAFI